MSAEWIYRVYIITYDKPVAEALCRATDIEQMPEEFEYFGVCQNLTKDGVDAWAISWPCKATLVTIAELFNAGELPQELIDSGLTAEQVEYARAVVRVKTVLYRDENGQLLENSESLDDFITSQGFERA